jgi:signal transduction histidine kinase
MNIRQRLRVSNLLMIVVPVVVSIAIALVVGFASWNVLAGGTGIRTDDSEDFFQASDLVMEAVRPYVTSDAIARLDDTGEVAQMLDSSNISLVITRDGETAYEHGSLSDLDRELLAETAQATGDLEVASGEHCLSVHVVSSGGSTWRVFVFGTVNDASAETTKDVIKVAIAAFAIALVVVVLLCNRFLSRFVLRHITEPLDQLAEGTRQIRDGNLDYRLPSGRTDEFGPVFDDFNDMARRLSESVERDRRAHERQAELVAGLSHDLRSPLTSIQAYAEGLRDGIAKTPEARADYVERILRKSQEMGALMRRMSEVTSLGRKADRVELAPASLDGVVGEWLDENGESYELRGARLSRQLAPARARISGELVSRILSNLLDNCLRYAAGPDDTCTVIVSCGVDGEGTWLAVDDDGPGVSEQDEEHLFDLFYRGDRARSVTSDGNGIGLAVVALGMDRMGGTVTASRSTLGGLRVTMRFPTCPSADETAPKPQPKDDAAGSADTADNAGRETDEGGK